MALMGGIIEGGGTRPSSDFVFFLQVGSGGRSAFQRLHWLLGFVGAGCGCFEPEMSQGVYGPWGARAPVGGEDGGEML